MEFQKEAEIFCGNVNRRRAEAGLAISELAQRSGLPLAMLEALEQGVIPEVMMVDDAFNLAQVFGCKIYELFE